MNLFKFGRKQPDLEDEDSIEGERELSSVNKGLTLQSKIINWVVAGGAVVLAVFLLGKYYIKMYEERQAAQGPVKDVSRTMTTATLPPLTLPDPDPPKVMQSAAAVEYPPLQQPTGAMNGATPAGAAPAGQPPVKSLAERVHERRLKSDVRFDLDGNAAGGAAPVGPEVAADPGAPALDGMPGAAPGAGARPAPARAVQQASFAASRAYMLPDPTLMMVRGQVIPCTVLPAMDTTLTGTVTCITGEDATGADNKVTLMERGTICTGKQGGGVAHGQRRVGIIWDRCRTPKDVLVPLTADATDSLGRPGIPGKVDTHFWDRFGGAIALSLITDIGPYLIATQQGGNNNTTVAFPNISGPQQVIAEVLKSTVDIKPTIEGPQASRVLIFLNGDLDFRDVYQLERTKP